MENVLKNLPTFLKKVYTM